MNKQIKPWPVYVAPFTGFLVIYDVFPELPAACLLVLHESHKLIHKTQFIPFFPQSSFIDMPLLKSVSDHLQI